MDRNSRLTGPPGCNRQPVRQPRPSRQETLETRKGVFYCHACQCKQTLVTTPPYPASSIQHPVSSIQYPVSSISPSIRLRIAAGKGTLSHDETRHALGFGPAGKVTQQKERLWRRQSWIPSWCDGSRTS